MGPDEKRLLIDAFDRLFERASDRFKLDSSKAERDEARKRFVDSYERAFEMIDEAGGGVISELDMHRMVESIENLSAANVAAYLAAGPLAVHVRESVQRIVNHRAEQRMIENWIDQADDTYGGN
jgi:hypothetical protein